MKAKNVLMSVAAGVLAMVIGTSPAMAQDAKPDTKPDAKAAHKAEKKLKKEEAKAASELAPGATAPEFKLTDSEGKTHSLSELTKSGKIVVLQWFNPECPYVMKHYNGTTKTFNELNAKYKDKGVVLLAVSSNATGKPGSGADRMNKARKDWNMAYPVLMDENGKVGQSYNAKNTPAMVVIGKDGKVAYMGAIDDNDGAEKPGKTNYVSKAIDEMLAGSSVSTPKTKPYGCGIKYEG